MARLEGIVRERIASFRALVADTVVHLFEDVGRITKSSTDTKVLSVIRPVVNNAISKTFKSATFYVAVEQAVHMYASKPKIADTVATRMINVTSLTVRAAKFKNHEIKKSSFKKRKMELVQLAEAVHGNIIREDDGIPTKKMDLSRAPNCRRDTFDDTKLIQRPAVHHLLRMSRISAVIQAIAERRRAATIETAGNIAPPFVPNREYSESDLEAQVQLNEMYQRAFVYRSYRPITEYQ